MQVHALPRPATRAEGIVTGCNSFRISFTRTEEIRSPADSQQPGKKHFYESERRIAHAWKLVYHFAKTQHDSKLQQNREHGGSEHLRHRSLFCTHLFEDEVNQVCNDQRYKALADRQVNKIVPSAWFHCESLEYRKRGRALSVASLFFHF